MNMLKIHVFVCVVRVGKEKEKLGARCMLFFRGLGYSFIVLLPSNIY